MKNPKYLFLLLFILMISTGFVSATDNDSLTDDVSVKVSSAMEVKTVKNVDTDEYTVKSTSELNNIVNYAKTDTDTLVINVDEDNFKDDAMLLLNIGDHNKTHQNIWSYNPLDPAGILERNQSYKNVVINANNVTFDLKADLRYEDLVHIQMDQYAFDEKIIYCGIVDVGKGYTLTFNDVQLKHYDIINYGTLLFNNSILSHQSRDDFVCDNHGTIIIENSVVKEGYSEANLFSNYENSTLIVRNSNFKWDGYIYDGGASIIAGGNVIIDGEVVEVPSIIEHTIDYFEEDNTASSTEDEGNIMESVNTTITFGNIVGTTGEIIPVRIYVNDEKGNKVDGGVVMIYFDDNIVVKDYTNISLLKPTSTDKCYYRVHDGQAIANVVFFNDTYSKIKAKYMGYDKYSSSYNEKEVSLDFPLRNASITVVNEENSANNITLTVEVKDLSGSDLVYNLDSVNDLVSEGLSFGLNFSTVKDTSYFYKEDGMFYLVIYKDNIPSNQESCEVDITYINPVYNEVSTKYSIVSIKNSSYDNSTIISSVKKITPGETIKNTIYNPVLKNINKKILYYTFATKSSKKIVTMVNRFNLGKLNDIFNMNFSNQTLLIYIGDTLVYNGTTTNNLLEVLFNISDKFKGNYTITVKTSNNTTYNETITI